MKIKNQIRILSFALAIIAAVTLLPLTTLTVNAVDNSEPEIYSSTDTESKNVEQSDTCSSGTVEETETAINEETEEETEEFCEEFEVEDSAISAPPMTQIGDVADPNALTFLPDGVYAIENVGNDNYYMSVEGGYTVAGYNMVQEKYSSGTPLTDFSRVSLFKVSRVGNTNQYVIRSMLNNRMSPVPGSDVDANKFITGYVNTDDASVTTTYTIMGSEGVYSIRPYGSMNVLAAPNTTVSGSGNSTEAQLILNTSSAAGDRGKWRFTAYTGNVKYGFRAGNGTGMANGLVKGDSGELNVKVWSTVIGANTAYVAVTPATSSIASSVWDAYSGRATITGVKCGDFKIKAEIRSGSSQTAIHSNTYSYTVIPDIVGDTAFIQNAVTERYIEVEGGSTTDGAIIQQNRPHTHPRIQWIFELGGNGYFKIKNVNSGKYIGADSSDSTKIRQYTSVTDYTLWKLTETSEGSYKMSCRASALSGKVLSVPSTTSGNGEDVTMIDYQNHSDFKDIWIVKGYVGSLNITVCVDEGYMARYPNYASKISQHMQDVKEKLFSDYFIEVTYSSTSSITTLADECSSSSGGNCESKCPHGDNNGLNNDSDGLCSNSSFSTTGSADKTLHHNNIYNTVYRITFPDISNNTLVIFSGHNYCKMDGGVHKDSGVYGMSWTNYGVALIKNFSSTLSERRTLLHEILHWYGIMDHYGGTQPSSADMGASYSPKCIFGEEKGTQFVLDNLTLCDGCRTVLVNNLYKFQH